MANRSLLALGAAAVLGVSATLLSLTSRHEGLRYRAYKDPVGIWTICYGHTSGVKPGMVATKAECDRMLAKDLAIAQAAVARHVRVPVSRNEFDAYTDLVFNMGEANFAKGSLPRLINARRHAEACRFILRYKYAQGIDCSVDRRCAGVWRRRHDQMELCLKPTKEIVWPSR